MQNAFLITALFSVILFAPVSKKETLITNEFWICDSPNTANLGTIDNPYDGSSRAKFDAVMGGLPPYSTIHILAGTYQTFGSYAWGSKSGQKIIGSGMDVTTLQLAAGIPATSAFVIDSPGIVTNVEVSDLTCDCNYTSRNVNFSGIALNGTRNAVRRVKVKNEAFAPGLGSEAWGINLNNLDLPASDGNIIEECEVDPLAAGHQISAICLMGGKYSTFISGTMRNNRVYLAPDPSGAQIAFNNAWATDCQVEGNYVDGADNGYVTDTGGCTNIIYAHNIFKNVYGGFVFSHYPRRNLTFAFNTILLCPTNWYFSAAFGFPDGTFHTNIMIIGNDVGWNGPPSRIANFLCVTNVVGLTVCDNTVDSRLKNYISAAGLHMFNNYDLHGNDLAELNTPLVSGLTTNITVLGTGSNTQTLCFTNGVLKAVR